MTSAFYIAMATFKEETRNKIFYLILFVLLGVIAFSGYLSVLSISDTAVAFGGFVLYFVKVVTVLGVLFSMTLGLYAERESKGYHLFILQLRYPFLYILGRFLGYNLLFDFVAAVSVMVVYVLEFTLFGVNLWGIWIYLLNTVLVFYMISGVALFFYTIFSTPIVSLLLCMATFFVGHLSVSFYFFVSHYPNVVVRWFLKVIYFLVPNLSIFSSEISVVHGAGNLLSFFSLFYALSYGSMMVVLASLIFYMWRDY